MQCLCPWKASSKLQGGQAALGRQEPAGLPSLQGLCCASCPSLGKPSSSFQDSGQRHLPEIPSHPPSTSPYLFTLSQATVSWATHAQVDTGPASAAPAVSAGPCVVSHPPLCPSRALPPRPSHMPCGSMLCPRLRESMAQHCFLSHPQATCKVPALSPGLESGGGYCVSSSSSCPLQPSTVLALGWAS